MADNLSESPASDIPLDDSDDMGVIGRWKIEIESIAVDDDLIEIAID